MYKKTKKTPFEIFCICIFVIIALIVFLALYGFRVAAWVTFFNRSFNEDTTYDGAVTKLSEHEDMVILPPEVFDSSHWCEYKIVNRKSGTEPFGYIIDLYYMEEDGSGRFQIMVEPNAFAVFDTSSKRIDKVLTTLKKDGSTIINKDGYNYRFYFYSGEFSKTENELRDALNYVLK